MTAFLIALGAITALTMVILVAVLFRQMRRIGGTVQGLLEDLEPLLEDLRTASEATRERLDRLAAEDGSEEADPGVEPSGRGRQR